MAFHHIKGHAKWLLNLTVVSTISLHSHSTNMRIPTPEFLAVFFATGQFSAPSNCKIPVLLLRGSMWLTHVCCHFHIVGTQFSLLNQPPCDREYTVKLGDICDTIAAANKAPTLVLHTSHFRILLMHCNAVTRSSVKMGSSTATATIFFLTKWNLFSNFCLEYSNYIIIEHLSWTQRTRLQGDCSRSMA
jgi:hypothetical protein